MIRSKTTKERSTKKLPILLGGIGALLVLLVFFPVGCGSTDIGIPEGGPDPNGATCSSLVLEQEMEGGDPRTKTSSTADFLLRRMATRALLLASIPLLVGCTVAFVLARRSKRASGGG